MNINKILISSDSFKGTLSSIEVCHIMNEAIINIMGSVDVKAIPIADGGEGTVDAFLESVGGEKIYVNVKGPFFEDIEAYYCIINDGRTAVIELAQAAGLSLVETKKNPMKTSTYGVGMMIKDALDKGCQKIIIGLGGSCTNDGGIGMLNALGVDFLDFGLKKISLDGEGLGGLNEINTSKLDNRIKNCIIEVACDIDNPLFGLNGAAHVYAPQKGADNQMIEILDSNLKNYAAVIQKITGLDVQKIKGAGAAGGVAAGLVSILNAQLRPGIEMIMEYTDFETHLKDSDLVITGEGKIDSQTTRGKVPIGIAKIASGYKIPVIAIVGCIDDHIDGIYKNGITATFSINRKPEDFSISKAKSKYNLLKTTEDIIRLLKVM